MKITAAFVLLCSPAAVAWAFAPPATTGVGARANNNVGHKASSMFLSAEPAATKETVAEETKTTTASINDTLQIPLSYNEMILQVSQCMLDAYETQGMTRQIVRILLPRAIDAGQLGEYIESDAQTSDRTQANEMKLVPTDESWQGGIMQLYRAASPTTKDILRELCPTSRATGVPPKIMEDRSIDESGVDGVGILYTQTGGSGDDDDESSDTVVADGGGFGGFFGGDITLPTLSDNDQCIFVQPSQEVIDSIDKLSTQTSDGKSLIALLNPQWRNVDDALDSASKSDSPFGAFASFLGGKGSVLRRLDELNYRPSYTLEGYVCKGGNIRLIKRFDSDWIVFAENDSGDKYVRVGSMVDRPSYQDVEKMLDDKGVGYKYARDLGMAPKL